MAYLNLIPETHWNVSHALVMCQKYNYSFQKYILCVCVGESQNFILTLMATTNDYYLLANVIS